jgi:hypothetical protein
MRSESPVVDKIGQNLRFSAEPDRKKCPSPALKGPKRWLYAEGLFIEIGEKGPAKGEQPLAINCSGHGLLTQRRVRDKGRELPSRAGR